MTPNTVNLPIIVILLPTERVGYVEEPMKYQALRSNFFSMVGGRVGVVGVGGWCGDGWMGGGGVVGGGGGVGIVVVLVVVVVVVVEWVGFGVCGVLVRDVLCGGGRMGGGMGDGSEEGGLLCGWWGGWYAGKFLISQGLRIFTHGGSRS